MKSICSAVTALSLVAVSQPAQAQGVASQTITLSNVANQCINTQTHAVSLWLTSIMIERKQNWLTSTNAVGAQTDLTLVSHTKGRQVFPRAREVSTNGVQGGYVRANLNFPLLQVYHFPQDANVVAIDAPLIFLRRTGDGDVAKYAKTIMKVTKPLAGIIPPNPFTQGVELAGQLANSFLEAAAEDDSKNVARPSFQVGHTLSRSNTCNANDLMTGMHAKISDPSSDPKAGMISVNDHHAYCFYQIGAPSDPNIGYVAKPTGGACPTAIPANTTVLQNPQIIYLVHAVTPAKIKAAQSAFALSSPMKAAMSSAVMSALVVDEEVQRALEICEFGGIGREECLGLTPVQLPGIEGFDPGRR